ncbi:MAG: nucleotidyl transferase AbiEii/AbiGii toxin family protein [Bryobacteraceae bacterium]|nr:nucleotidyl transferase AbiEii/AbiGii toxin family protein [Bryobacteraceae bacterium]
MASEADCPYFVAGATARDLVLVHVHGLRPGRATRDVDFGVAVQNWEQFGTLKQRAQASGMFRTHPHAMQRLVFNDAETGVELPVDLIPFRGVTSSDYRIEWPPNGDVVMNVAGFEEALDSSVALLVEDGLPVRVASIPGLAVLKLVAWMDRRNITNKDAADLYRLIATYGDAGIADRLYDQEMALLEVHEFDTQLAGAALLGRDAAELSRPSTRELIAGLVAGDAGYGSLVDQVLQTSSMPETRESTSRLMEAFRRGLTIESGSLVDRPQW